MKVLILIGSAARNSCSLHLGKAIASRLDAQGVSAELIDLIAFDLPPFDADTDRTKAHNKTTKEFIKRAKAAHALVYITPVYHNSFSGAIKNAIDWLHFPMDGKVVGLASHGNNRTLVAVDQLMVVARSQHLVVLPTRVCTQREDYDKDLQIVTPAINKRLDRFVEELMHLGKRLAK
jgi:azobenzene reductase